MEPIFQQDFDLTDAYVDRYGRLKPSSILFIAQEVAGRHCIRLEVDYESLASRNLFWAVTRHKVQISRLPMRGERIRIETWPMPTTRVAYPRSMVAYDASGQELFRSISLWVLMDLSSRNMVLPGKSGVDVEGLLRGNELASPLGLPSRPMDLIRQRTVCYTDLDRNGHMNNTRYLDWIDDLLPSAFHEEHTIREMTVCYLSEAREGQILSTHWDLAQDGYLHVDTYRTQETKDERIFSARLLFD